MKSQVNTDDNSSSTLKVDKIRIEIKDKSNIIINQISAKERISLIYTQEYKAGDKICFTNFSENKYLVVNLDGELSEALIYVPGRTHIIKMRIAKKEKVYCYRNLAKNVMDQRGETTYYPHATANVETRNEAVFAARNTIDGQTNTKGHGVWPYESWGTWQRADAELIIDFGREVEVDKIALYLRADFPHDTYWNATKIVFSDGTQKDVQLIKNDKAQYIEFDKKRISWVKLMNFEKANEPSEFVALTEIQVYGIDIKGI